MIFRFWNMVCDVNLHVNCSNVLIDQDVSVAGSISSLQQSSPFTQIGDINLSNLFTPNA